MTVPTESGALLEPESFAALLEAEDWSALQARGQRRKVARAAVLMYEGDPGDRVVVLLAGRVKVTTTGDDGQETLLSIRGPGEILGELSFLDDQPRLSTVTTLEPVEILAIAAAGFGRYLEERPRVALVILRTLSARFRDASRKRVQFRELDTVGRLAARLVELCERYGEAHTGRDDHQPATHSGGARCLDRRVARGRRQGVADAPRVGLDPDATQADRRSQHRCAAPPQLVEPTGRRAGSRADGGSAAAVIGHRRQDDPAPAR